MKSIYIVSILILLSAAVPATATQRLAYGPGFNFLGLAVSPASPLTSDMLLDDPTVTQVFRFDAASQSFRYQLRLDGGGLFGTPFPLAPGEGFVLRAAGEGAREVTGEPLPADMPFPLGDGFSFVAPPAPPPGLAARALFAATPGLAALFRWSRDIAAFEFTLRLPDGGLFGPDLPLFAGEALFLRATAGTVARFGPSALLALEFSPPAGGYESAVAVTIAAAADGATIRYTLDGSEPSADHGTVYAAPVVVGTDALLKAVAFKEGSVGRTARAAYLIGVAPPPLAVVPYPAISDHETALDALVRMAEAHDAALARIVAHLSADGTAPLFSSPLPAAAFAELSRDMERVALAADGYARATEYIAARAAATSVAPPAAPRRFIAGAKGFFYDWAFGSRRRNRERILAVVAAVRARGAGIYATTLDDLHAVARAKFGAATVGESGAEMLARLEAGRLDVEAAQLLANFSTCGIDAYDEEASRLSLRPVDVAAREGAEGLVRGGEFYVDAGTAVVGARYPLLKDSIGRTRETFEAIRDKDAYATVTGADEWIRAGRPSGAADPLPAPDPAEVERRLARFLRDLKRREADGPAPGGAYALLDGPGGLRDEALAMLALHPDGRLAIKPDAPGEWTPFRVDPGTVEFLVLGRGASGNRIMVIPGYEVRDGSGDLFFLDFRTRPPLVRLDLTGPEHPPVYPTLSFDLANVVATAVYGNGDRRPVTPVFTPVAGGGSVDGMRYLAGAAPGPVTLAARFEEYGATVEATYAFAVRVPRLAVDPPALYTYATVGFDLVFLRSTLDGTDETIPAAFSLLAGPGAVEGTRYEPGDLPGAARIGLSGDWAGLPATGEVAVEVRAFPGVSLSTAEVRLAADGSLSLDAVTGFAAGTTIEVPLSWSLQAGDGALAGTAYRAPRRSGTATLRATYRNGAVVASADLVARTVEPVSLELVPPAARIRANETYPLRTVVARVTWSDARISEEEEAWSDGDSFTPPGPGRYEPQASFAAGDATVAAPFPLEVAPELAEAEPNDTPAQAMALPEGKTVECLLNPNGYLAGAPLDAADWFRFELSTDARVLFRLARHTYPGYADAWVQGGVRYQYFLMELFDASGGRFLIMYDDAGVLHNGDDSGVRAPVPLTAGVYHLKASLGAPAFLRYDLRMEVLRPGFADDATAADTWQEAARLVIGVPFEGHLGYRTGVFTTDGTNNLARDTVDWLVFTPAQSGTLTFTLEMDGSAPIYPYRFFWMNESVSMPQENNPAGSGVAYWTDPPPERYTLQHTLQVSAGTTCYLKLELSGFPGSPPHGFRAGGYRVTLSP